MSNRPARFRFFSLPLTVIRLGWVSFIVDLGSEMTVPVLTLFLASLGAPGLFFGVMEGSSEALVSLMRGWSGWHSDRASRKVPYVVCGYGLSVLARPLLAFVTTWPAVFFIRSLDRFGKGLRTAARDALLAQAAPRGEKGRAFGFHRTMDTVGAVIGLIACVAWLTIYPGHYAAVFLASAVPGSIAVYLTTKIPELEPNSCQPAVVGMAASVRCLPRSYWLALGIVGIFSLAKSSDAFLILRAHQLGQSDAATVVYYGIFYASYALLAYPAGVLSDRLGRWHTLAMGWSLYAVVYAEFATLKPSQDNFLKLAVLFCLCGFYMGFSEGIGRAFLSDFAPRHLQGTAQGLMGVVLGIGALLSSLVAGYLWDRVGPDAPFALGASLTMVALLLLTITGALGRLRPPGEILSRAPG